MVKSTAVISSAEAGVGLLFPQQAKIGCDDEPIWQIGNGMRAAACDAYFSVFYESFSKGFAFQVCI
jgi:hypothetical protein